MQTFLPYPDFRSSGLALDRRRLGKQRVEALQVLRGLVVPGYGWRHHPAVRMWTGYEEALVRYGLEICRVWREQGHQDSCAATLIADFLAFRPHAALHAQAELRPGHFERWLTLWRATVDELFAGERAELAKAHAERVARAFLMRLQAHPSALDRGAAEAGGGLVVTRHGPGE